MQAVILAAGLGTRMRPLTDNLPKPMLPILGKSILEYKLEALPESITEIIIIIGYKGEEIKKYFGDTYKEKKISYVIEKDLSGTAHALWQAKDFLKGRFLVMMGDDIYSPASIKECSETNWSLCCKKAKVGEDYGRVILDENKNVVDFVTAENYRKNFNDDGLIFTGLYSMTDEIFNYDPVKLKTKEEWGLPQTFLKACAGRKVKIIETDFWLSISSPEDLEAAEKEIK